MTQMPPKLVAYWTTGEGGRSIKWGTPGDFDRAVRELGNATDGKLPPNVLKGMASNLHKIATGKRPGEH